MITWTDVLEFAEKGNPQPSSRIEKSEDEWREMLTEEEYRVMRQKGTERAYTGQYCEAFEPGTYACRGCGTVLFDAGEKFESRSGWPSFTQPASEAAIRYEIDRSLGMVRVEILCNSCDAHLGHVFNDGPKPSGLRYCVNSVSLKKIS